MTLKRNKHMDKPKKLILDYSKWRCGGTWDHQVGDGDVALLNAQGFMCCLGQWHRQCGISDSDLLDKGEPNELPEQTDLFSFESDWNPQGECIEIKNTNLSERAICINDAEDTTPEEKINLLTKLLETEGIELEVINKP
jgi:hypothetical protein